MQPLNDRSRTILLTSLGIKNAIGLNAGRRKYTNPQPIKQPNPLSYRTKPKQPRTHALGVRCIETGEVFPSLIATAQAHNIRPSNLSDHLRGAHHKVGGRTYEYAPDAGTPKKRDTTKRPIRCVDTGEVFASLTETSRAHKIATNSLSLHLRGIQSNVRGKRYEYITPITN